MEKSTDSNPTPITLAEWCAVVAIGSVYLRKSASSADKFIHSEVDLGISLCFLKKGRESTGGFYPQMTQIFADNESRLNDPYATLRQNPPQTEWVFSFLTTNEG